MSFLDGLFHLKLWLNGTETITSPQPLDIVGEGITLTTTNGRSVLDLSGLAADGGVAEHAADTDNPHETNIGNLGGGTLAELSAIITDADIADAAVLAAHITDTANPHGTDIANLGQGTLAELNGRVSDANLVPEARTITAGTGLTGGGDLSANRTLNVAANADGSIVVNADDIQVGVLATDAQHGDRGGGDLHDDATTSVSGFMSAADKRKLEPFIDFVVDTSDATPVQAGSIPLTDDAVMRLYWSFAGKDGSGNRCTSSGVHEFHRHDGAAPAALGSPQSLKTHDATAGIGGVSLGTSGNNITASFTGLSGAITGRLKVWAYEELDL